MKKKQKEKKRKRTKQNSPIVYVIQSIDFSFWFDLFGAVVQCASFTVNGKLRLCKVKHIPPKKKRVKWEDDNGNCYKNNQIAFAYMLHKHWAYWIIDYSVFFFCSILTVAMRYMFIFSPSQHIAFNNFWSHQNYNKLNRLKHGNT